MQTKHTVLIGKAAQKLAKLRGGGSALPGLVVEKIDKNFVARCLSQLPLGVVIITGTNGKTTTTKMVTELLKTGGLKVLTNKTGSNFIRGVASALLENVDSEGKLNHDIAVLELDEAHATHFVRQVKPSYVLALNVMRDQLDRFGEIDHTAKLVETVVLSATKGVVLNKDDPRIVAIAKLLPSNVERRYFSASNNLLSLFINDDALHTKMANVTMVETTETLLRGDVRLNSFKANQVDFQIGHKNHKTGLKLSGVYNFLNAAGALAMAKLVLGDKSSDESLVKALGEVTPAFGRGEVITARGSQIEVILIKNPAGFRLALEGAKPAETMIAINDAYADGRDMSWLWDVDFSKFKTSGVGVVSGIRAHDMALRLQYDNVQVSVVEPDLKSALSAFLENPEDNRRIFCTYTAMLAIRKLLKQEHLK